MSLEFNIVRYQFTASVSTVLWKCLIPTVITLLHYLVVRLSLEVCSTAWAGLKDLYFWRRFQYLTYSLQRHQFACTWHGCQRKIASTELRLNILSSVSAVWTIKPWFVLQLNNIQGLYVSLCSYNEYQFQGRRLVGNMRHFLSIIFLLLTSLLYIIEHPFFCFSNIHFWKYSLPSILACAPTLYSQLIQRRQ